MSSIELLLKDLESFKLIQPFRDLAKEENLKAEFSGLELFKKLHAYQMDIEEKAFDAWDEKSDKQLAETRGDVDDDWFDEIWNDNTINDWCAQENRKFEAERDAKITTT